MFYLTVLVFFCIINVNGEDNFFVIKHFGKDADWYYCITNSSFPLTWSNYEKSAPYFFPISKNNFKIRFSPNIWFRENSLTGRVNEIILDRRWEYEPTLKTNNERLYVDSRSFTSNNFVFPFSIQFDKAAHIFLCHNTSCYWFMLSSRSESFLKICERSVLSLPSYNEIRENSTVLLDSTDSINTFYNTNKWLHFKLSKNQNYLKLLKINENDKTELLVFKNDKIFDTTELFTETDAEGDLVGYWKYHKIEYYYTTLLLNKEPLGHVSNIANNLVCFSIFVTMCPKCELTLTLHKQDDPNDKIIASSTYKYTSWTEIKFLVENVNEKNVSLKISTKSSVGPGSFWAIDRWRSCEKNEFRYIKTSSDNKDVKCEMIKYNQETLSFDEGMENIVNNCPGNTFGKYCFPCFWGVLRKRDPFKICENISKQKRCYCSAGYKNNDLSCSSPCSQGTYGHGCKKSCDYCMNKKCDNIDGICQTSCIEGYTGSRCDKASNSVRNLSVYSKNESSISLRWKPPHPPTGKLYQYKLTYEIANSKNKPSSKNVSIRPCTLWPEYHCFKLSGLETQKIYLLNIQASNEDPPDFGQASNNLTVITQIEQPEAPYNLTIEWTLENNLILKWTHPNVTNGDIRNFEIKLIPNSNKPNILKIMDIEKYSFRYNYTINANEIEMSTNYTIKISAFNGYYSLNLIGYDTSPPSIPTFDKEPRISITEKSIEIEAETVKLKTLRNHTYEIFLLVADSKNENISSQKNILMALRNYQLNVKQVRLICKWKVINLTKRLYKTNEAINKCNYFETILIEDIDSHKFNIILCTTFQDKSRCKKTEISGKYGSTSSLLFLLLLLVLLPVALLIYRKFYNTKRDVTDRNKIGLQNMNVGQDQALLNTASDTNQDIKEINKENKNIQQKKINKFSNMISKPVLLQDFKQYVSESEQNGELKRQFEMLTKKVTQQIYEPFEDNYQIIDLNFSDGSTIAKAYCVSVDVPKKDNTIEEFWRRTVEDHSKLIVLFGELHLQKSKKYWPESNKKLVYEDFCVYHVHTQSFEFYTHRIFLIIKDGVNIKVDHIHSEYSGQNPKKLIPLLKKISEYPLRADFSILIQSSVGIGGVGLVLLSDVCLRMASKEKIVDVIKSYQILKTYRSGLIRNAESYKLVHLIISGVLSDYDTQIENDYVNY